MSGPTEIGQFANRLTRPALFAFQPLPELAGLTDPDGNALRFASLILHSANRMRFSLSIDPNGDTSNANAPGGAVFTFQNAAGGNAFSFSVDEMSASSDGDTTDRYDWRNITGAVQARYEAFRTAVQGDSSVYSILWRLPGDTALALRAGGGVHETIYAGGQLQTKWYLGGEVIYEA